MAKFNTEKPAGQPVGGVDTGKSWLDVAIVGDAAVLRCANSDGGRAELVAHLQRQGVRRVGIEASGGYEIEVVAAMRAAGLEVVVFQPAQVRAYARFLNQRAKTDRIDAQLIARCAAARRGSADAPDPRLAPFAEHLTFIEQIEEDIARLRTRLDRYRDPRLAEALKADIARLKTLRKEELRRLRAAVRAHDDLAGRLDLLVSIEGLGERTGLCLLIRMPELGSLTHAQAGALAGMAPVTRQSGRWQGESHVEGGRARVGKALFAAAQAAAQRWNKHLLDLYRRLKAQGKHHNVAVVACARKLVTFANAVLQRGRPWVPAS
jgi:transposase